MSKKEGVTARAQKKLKILHAPNVGEESTKMAVTRCLALVATQHIRGRLTMPSEQPDLNNPMRFALHDRKIDVAKYLGDSRSVTEIESRPAEGNIYVHWEADNGE